MTYRFIIFSSFFASFVLLLSGCGGEQLPPGIPKLYNATLTVMQDGKPLAGADIIMLNIDPSVNWPAGGITNQNGVAKLRTLGRYDGAPAGRYKVAVNKIDTPDITLPSPDEVSATEFNRLVKEIEDNTFYVVDPKFSLGKTELEVEITPSNLKHTVDVSPAIHVKVPPSPKG